MSDGAILLIGGSCLSAYGGIINGIVSRSVRRQEYLRSSAASDAGPTQNWMSAMSRGLPTLTATFVCLALLGLSVVLNDSGIAGMGVTFWIGAPACIGFFLLMGLSWFVIFRNRPKMFLPKWARDLPPYNPRPPHRGRP